MNALYIHVDIYAYKSFLITCEQFRPKWTFDLYLS